MKKSRITVTGDFRADDTANYKVTETVFNGDGALDYTNTIIAQGTTDIVLFDEGNDEDLSNEYFYSKFAKEGFDFICEIQ